MKVRNMTNSNGRAVPNQFVIETTERENWENGDYTDREVEYFQSYDCIIVRRAKFQKVELDSRYWDYSKTTSRYRNQFPGETTKETQAKIDSGEYILTDLN